MKIKLAGELGKRFGKTYKLAVRSPNEAIRALCHIVPGFRSYLTSAHEYGVYFQILTDTGDKEGIDYLSLDFGCTEFTLVPMITGALFGKGGAITSILIGLALVAFAFTGFGIVSFGAAGTISAGVQTAIATLGFGLIFNGVASLFAPGAPQQGSNEAADADQAIFGGAPPPVANGSVVPLLYGEFLVTNAPVIASYIDDNEGYWMGLLSEGEIIGFPTGSDKDLYLNGLAAEYTPLEALQFTDGTQNSAVIDLVKSAGFHIPVGATMNFQGGEYDDDDDGTPNTVITRSFTQPRADKVIVRMSIGPCYQTRQKSSGGGSSSNFRDYTEEDDSGGARNPTEVEITLRDGDGNVIGDRDETFILNTGTILYTEEFDIDDDTEMPISVTVERVDRKGPRDPRTKGGETSSRTYTWVKSPITFNSIDVIWNERLVYPHSALLALKFRTGEFTEIPRIQARMKGLKVPTLSSSLKVSYAWSDNPAYILLDLLTQPRYGAGFRKYDTTGPNSREVVQPGIRMQDIDLGSFRAAATYCEDNDITFNGYINRDSDAIELFRGICSVMQAQLVYAGGFITLVIDKEVTDVRDFRLYSAANTIQEKDSEGAAPAFSYEGTARKARSTAVEVTYINPDQFYREEKVLEENVEAIERYGYNLVRIRALGCTSRTQARRMARYTLASNVLSTETVSFKVGPDGAMVIPGDICIINDPVKTGRGDGGRILAVDSGGITIDRSIESAGYDNGNWYLYTYGETGLTQRNQVRDVDRSTGRVRINGSWNNQPDVMHMWALVNESPNTPEYFPRYRVQSVKENKDGTYEIVAIKYNPDKFQYMRTGNLDLPTYSLRVFKGENTFIASDSFSFQMRTPETAQPQPAEQQELSAINGGSALSSDFD